MHSREEQVSKLVGQKLHCDYMYSDQQGRWLGCFSCQPYLDRGSNENYYYLFMSVEGIVTLIASGDSEPSITHVYKAIAKFAWLR